MSNQIPKFKYRPEIDGLRAISVLAVILFHADLGVTGGYVGVDVFFVISGFLITSLLLRDIRAGNFSLADFWERRARRIMPALSVVLATVVVVGYLLLLPQDLVELCESTVAQGLLVANIYFWQETGYFAGPAELKPLLHTWSLAVEEQFYLFYPIFLFLVMRYCPKRLSQILLAIAIVSFGINVFAIGKYPSATFFLLPTRAWELLAGSLLSIYTIPKWASLKTLKELASCGSLALILFAMLAFTQKTQFPGWAAAVPVLGASGFIFFNSDGVTKSGQLLATRPLVFIGLISYSLYLWHWPIFAYLRYTINDCTPLILAGGGLASILVAAFSYCYIEQPFRKRTVFKTRSSVFLFTGVYLSLLVAAGFYFIQQSGFPNRYDSEIQAHLVDSVHSGNEFQTTLSHLNSYGLKPIGIESEAAFDFLLLGDSQAMAAVALVDELAEKHNLHGAVAANNTTIPLPEVWSSRKEIDGLETMEWNQKVRELIRENQTKNVIIVAAWNWYLEGWTDERLESDPSLIESRCYAIGSRHDDQGKEQASHAMENGLRTLLADFQNENIRVWIVPQVPEATEDQIARQFLRWKLFPNVNSPPTVNGRSKESHLRRAASEHQLFEVVNEFQNSVVVDIESQFFQDGTAVHYGESAFYRDAGHLSLSGVRTKLTMPFTQLIQSIADAKQLSPATEQSEE